MKRQEAIDQVNRAFEVLGNPLRLRIFLKILNEGCDCDIEEQKGFTGNCVGGIVEELSIPQSTASTYIKSLADAGLIECKKNGKYLHCRPNREVLLNMKSFIDSCISQLRYE